MQQEIHSSLSYEQQILVTVLFVLQCIIICSAFFARKAPDNSPGKYLPFLYVLLAAGVVVGIFLVVAMWRGLWGFSSGHWADYHLYTALLWSMLVEDVYFSGFAVRVFGETNINGNVVKRFLQFLSVIGIALLATDMGVREPPRYLTTSGVAVHRGSMLLAYCIMFYSDIRRASNTKRACTNAELWISIGIRAVCEFLTFGLSFLSFHDGLASPLNYKLFSNGLFTFIGLVHGLTRLGLVHVLIQAWNYCRSKVEKRTRREQPDDVSFSDLSRMESTPGDSKDRLVGAAEEL